jgi:hypothetical protein
MTNRTSQTEQTFSYYVIAVSYPRSVNDLTGQMRPACIEAIVDPEMTRADAVEKVREIIGDGKEIAFAHFITMNDAPEDVKDRLIEAAGRPEVEAEVIDFQAARFDHARDLRKHEVV